MVGPMDQVLATPTTPDQLRAVVRQQAGVVSRGQLLAAGFSRQAGRDRVRARRWQRVHPGVYLTHTGPLGYRERCWAALLALGGTGVLAGPSAAFLDHLIAREPHLVHVLVPHTRPVRGQLHGVQVRRTRRRIGSVDSPPRTWLARTAVDLAESSRGEDDVVGHITAAARRLGSLASLRADVEARGRMRHRGLIEDLLAPLSEGLESPLELRFDRRVLRRHGLPRLERQVLTNLDDGTIRSDLRSKRFSLRIELDGRVHLDKDAQDVWRDNAVALSHGELTLRYRWAHVVGRPCEVAAQVARALRRGGWRGTPRPCGPDCPLG